MPYILSCAGRLSAHSMSRQTATIELATPFGNLPSKTQQDITAIVTDILERLRYVDVRTHVALLHLYSHEQDARQRDHIVRVVQELSEYNLHVWQKAGPGAQTVLTDGIDDYFHGADPMPRPTAHGVA